MGNRDRQLKGLVAPSGAVRQILALLESYSAQGEQWFSCASETRFHFAPRRGLPPLRRTYRKCPAFSDVKNASITASMAVLIPENALRFRHHDGADATGEEPSGLMKTLGFQDARRSLSMSRRTTNDSELAVCRRWSGVPKKSQRKVGVNLPFQIIAQIMYAPRPRSKSPTASLMVPRCSFRQPSSDFEVWPT